MPFPLLGGAFSTLSWTVVPSSLALKSLEQRCDNSETEAALSEAHAIQISAGKDSRNAKILSESCVLRWLRDVADSFGIKFVSDRIYSV
jgi:hypothetical protein